MAIYRSVQMNFWTDTKIADNFTTDEKLLYLYLLTNPHTNLCGCYEISINQMSAEIGFKKETIKRMLERLQNEHQSVIYSEETKEVLLLNWHKYNWTSSEKFKKPLMKEISMIKEKSFRTYLEKISEGEDTVSIPYPYGSDTTVSVTDTVTVTDTVSDSVSDSKPIKHKYGEYKNVLLTDEELSKLKAEFPGDWEKRIEDLSFYIKSKGAHYSSHLATIRNWGRKDAQKKTEKPKQNAFTNFPQRNYDFDALERQLLAAQMQR